MNIKNHTVRIIADSTADFDEVKCSNFEVIPLTIRFGDEEYVDGVTIDRKMFYEKLMTCEELPTTSQVTPAAFTEQIDKVIAAGETAVIITISSRLSGTFQSAMLAAAEYPEQIYVVDSRNASIGTGILVEYAMQLAKAGHTAAEIFDELIAVRERICTIAVVDTLEYLKKGGRLSSAEAFVGGVLSIKPIITLADGEVKTLGKARGTRQANQFLIREIDKCGGIDPEKPFMFGYTGLDEAPITKFISDCGEIFGQSSENLPVAAIGSVIGVHAGPGAVAISFFRK